ncbi:MAG: PhoH family protein [Gammaproteobacteria bacterium]|nr:PhoH family protein [Gammaproteobacteria bacterium]MYD75481.1 PhoH family protein [Gammaproteobacteria bacterium]MYJ51646.1 PhoH family protein [Gammaproteobacteria bacterium]
MNCHLKQIEENLQVRIVNRSNRFSITGSSSGSAQASSVVKKLFAMTEDRSRPISPGDVALALSAVDDADGSVAGNPDSLGKDDDEVVLNLRKNVIRGHNLRQRAYLKNIRDNDINFGIGPAGTGKTYLAVASAVHALTRNEIERILLVRPAVEAGEKLGFLPGDIGQKIDPYLRPLFDALYQMLGYERVGKLIARGTIELAPLAYMRGRTLNESFVILDEAQNTTVEQMKMFLTRIGFNSRAVVTGDITQIDLPRDQLSGLKHAQGVLREVRGISFTNFKPQDVVRHPLVQRIVEAYEMDPGGG